MKKKYKHFSKILSLGLVLIMCISAVPFSSITASAGNFDVTVSNVPFPRSNAKPAGNIKTDNSLYEFMGWFWRNTSNDEFAIGPQSFLDNYSKIASVMDTELTTSLTKFTNGKIYKFSVLLKLKGVSISTDCAVTFKDEDGNEIWYDDECQIIPASMILGELSDDVSVPESFLSKNDSILVAETNTMICSPTSHKHDNTGGLTSDRDYHWSTCSQCGEK